MESRGRFDVQTHPGDGDRAKKVAVRERKDSAVDRRCEGDEVHRSRVDLRWSLASRAPIFVQLPTRLNFVNRPGGHAFVLAVVDLAQHSSQLWEGEAGELGSPSRALKWAGEHRVEIHRLEAPLQGRRLLLTVRGQREIGVACVSPALAPLRLAVAREVDLEAQAGLPIISGLPERNERLALSITAPARTRWPGRTQTKPTVA